MATTRIWDVRGWLGQVVNYVENPDKTGNPHFTDTDFQGLRDVMNYATQDYKTEQQYYVSGINCSPDIARQQMIMTKKRYGKEGGIVAFHAYQSFAPNEVTPDQAHQIGIKLAQEVWGDRFEVIVATHLDKAHIHNHFVLNSVSFADGKRYNDCKATYKRMREASDRLCLENSLSVITNPKKSRKKPYPIVQAEKCSKPTLYNIIRSDIDITVGQSISMQGFIRQLRSLGYEIKAGKYLAVRPQGKERFIRLKTLGEDYSEDAIKNRILAQRIPKLPRPTPHRKLSFGWIKGSLKKAKKVKGLRALYLYYCYKLGILPKDNPNKPVHPLLREEIRHMDEISVQTKLLIKYKIDTIEQLDAFIEKLEQEQVSLKFQRTEANKKLHRSIEPDMISDLNSQRLVISNRLYVLRRELKAANGIEERSELQKHILTTITASTPTIARQKNLYRTER
jgi:hypothetical protein